MCECKKCFVEPVDFRSGNSIATKFNDNKSTVMRLTVFMSVCVFFCDFEVKQIVLRQRLHTGNRCSAHLMDQQQTLRQLY